MMAGLVLLRPPNTISTSVLSELPPLIEVAASYFNEDCAPTDVTG